MKRVPEMDAVEKGEVLLTRVPGADTHSSAYDVVLRHEVRKK